MNKLIVCILFAACIAHILAKPADPDPAAAAAKAADPAKDAGEKAKDAADPAKAADAAKDAAAKGKDATKGNPFESAMGNVAKDVTDMSKDAVSVARDFFFPFSSFK